MCSKSILEATIQSSSTSSGLKTSRCWFCSISHLSHQQHWQQVKVWDENKGDPCSSSGVSQELVGEHENSSSPSVGGATFSLSGT